MTAPGFLRRPDGSVLLAGLAPAFVHVLHELPSLLDAEDEAIHGRLFPYPSDDPDERKEWERLVHPDLFALVRSAREIVAKDLAGLVEDPDAPFFPTWDLVIPAQHVQGWLAALNAGRLALGARHGIEEDDMADLMPADEIDERRTVVLKIHLLGWLQQVLIEGLHPPPEDVADDDEPSPA